MLRNNLRFLLIGYSETDAMALGAELSKINSKINCKAITDANDIRIAFYECEWHVLICNYTKDSGSLKEALEVWRQVGRDTPFIIYADETSDEKVISAIHYGVHDYVYKGHIARLVFVIERELKNLEIKRAKLQAESKIYRLTYYDNLTGFPKRNLFCEKVTEILSKQSNEKKLAGVYLIKIGGLPDINSTYGYHVGDMLIQQLSYRMSVYTNSQCLLSRIGGSKFVFFNCDVKNLEDVQNFADKIMHMVSIPMVINDLEFYVTLNIGVSIYPTHGDTVSSLLANAENAFCDPGYKWHNSCRYFLNKPDEISTKRVFTREALRRAIINNELELLYQPIINLDTGGFRGVEAILRWNHPEAGPLTPSELFPFIYENGLILEIGKWALKQACLQAKFWHEMGYDALTITLALAVSGFDQAHFIKYVQNMLAETKLPPQLLELELPESFLQGAEFCMANLKELSDTGVRFSINNYGTGGASIRCLNILPVNSLKLDPELTSNQNISSENSAVVTAINAMAKNLGLSVIAQGITGKAQLNILYETQCKFAQGDYFSQPVSAEDFLKLLEQRKTGTLD
ncbi:diguanylate cyclase (GGDEF) domain-containing protein [Nitrosomonas sp. Nm51]|nr:diguanylate cyclase (GGDEF) domain-containing protein [Nitrosomonas sp. Nm51]